MCMNKLENILVRASGKRERERESPRASTVMAELANACGFKINLVLYEERVTVSSEHFLLLDKSFYYAVKLIKPQSKGSKSQCK